LVVGLYSKCESIIETEKKANKVGGVEKLTLHIADIDGLEGVDDSSALLFEEVVIADLAG
jgi:hypothetical protein